MNTSSKPQDIVSWEKQN